MKKMEIIESLRITISEAIGMLESGEATKTKVAYFLRKNMWPEDKEG